MTQRKTKIAIIGAGTAGMSAYRAASRHTDDVLLIEGGPYGTTCARVGCMPSKLLIAAADAAHGARHAERFGVHATRVGVDGEAVMARLRSERDRFVSLVVDTVEDWPASQRLRGAARFVAPGVLEVDGHGRVEAERIVIATGSSPSVPPAIADGAGDRLIFNDELFDRETLPASVAVVGGGVIGLELAQALHRLGVRVRLFSRGNRLGPATDPEIQAETRALMTAELPVCANSRIASVRHDADSVTLSYVADIDAGDTVQEETFEWLLAATGRRPNLAGLDLGAAGVVLDEHGMPAFDRHTAQIGDLPIFIAGDVTNDRPLLHEAADAGRIAGDNAARYPEVRVGLRRVPLSVVFSDPQIALAGASHRELCAQDVAFAVGEVSFADQGRSRVMGVNAGLLRVYGEHHSGRFLGAEMVGPAAEHLGHLLAWSIHAGMTVPQMLAAPFYHPVIEEGLRTALRQLEHRLRLGPQPGRGCAECGPGG